MKINKNRELLCIKKMIIIFWPYFGLNFQFYKCFLQGIETFTSSVFPIRFPLQQVTLIFWEIQAVKINENRELLCIKKNAYNFLALFWLEFSIL